MADIIHKFIKNEQPYNYKRSNLIIKTVSDLIIHKKRTTLYNVIKKECPYNSYKKTSALIIREQIANV